MAEFGGFGVSLSSDVLKYGLLAGIGAGVLGGGVYFLRKRMKEASVGDEIRALSSVPPPGAGQPVRGGDREPYVHGLPLHASGGVPGPPQRAGHRSGFPAALRATLQQAPAGIYARIRLKGKCSYKTCVIFQEGVMKRALDLGCAVGRSTFELARDFEEVVGVDYSAAFIQRCQELKMTGRAAYKLKTEGDLGENRIAIIHPEIVTALSLSLSLRLRLCMCAIPPGPEQGGVHGGKWLQPPSTGPVWLCPGCQRHLSTAGPHFLLPPTPLHGGGGRHRGNHLLLLLAGRVHPKGQPAHEKFIFKVCVCRPSGWEASGMKMGAKFVLVTN